ncbi:MAG TPA: YicC/YloC family endoribonuclease [Terriglobia bacterium]|nr:YicC/YloC family endoribonuclease [Terriglobia bacterium]
MTGYSAGRSDEADYSLSVSLKSTNHRFLDVQLRLPSSLEALEVAIRRQVKERLARGHVEVTVTFERAGAQTLELNRRLLEGYVSACDGLRREFGVLAPPDPVALLRIPGMIATADGVLTAETLERVWAVLERLVGQSLDELDAMRSAEGAALERDLRARFERLGELRSGVERLAGSVPEIYRQRLDDRLRELTARTPGAPMLEPGRLAQEVLYLASRSDISEELTRLGSHLAQAATLMNEGPEVGKKLDFLLQEMNREANTILSKTTDVPGAGPEIARQAIEMKTEVEKLREQAQNIE